MTICALHFGTDLLILLPTGDSSQILIAQCFPYPQLLSQLTKIIQDCQQKKNHYLLINLDKVKNEKQEPITDHEFCKLQLKKPLFRLRISQKITEKMLQKGFLVFIHREKSYCSAFSGKKDVSGEKILPNQPKPSHNIQYLGKNRFQFLHCIIPGQKKKSKIDQKKGKHLKVDFQCPYHSNVKNGNNYIGNENKH